MVHYLHTSIYSEIQVLQSIVSHEQSSSGHTVTSPDLTGGLEHADHELEDIISNQVLFLGVIICVIIKAIRLIATLYFPSFIPVLFTSFE